MAKSPCGPTRLLLSVMLFCFAPLCARAQDDQEWPRLSYLRHDYRAVALVAHVEVTEAEIVGRIPGYENWHLRGTIVEPFKGKLLKGDSLEFYHGAEAGFRRELFLGQKIVFLLNDYDQEKKARVLTVLENSTLPFTEERARKLRVIQRERRRHPPK
jgi:hypothetical protein